MTGRIGFRLNPAGDQAPVDPDKPFCILHGLPIPPSANALFRDARRDATDKSGVPIRGPEGDPVFHHFRAKTSVYKKWVKEAVMRTWMQGRFPRQRDKKAPGWPYRVEIHINVDRKSDIDNRLKAILDMMKAALLTPDDRWCDDVRIIRSRDDVPPRRFTIQIWRIG